MSVKRMNTELKNKTLLWIKDFVIFVVFTAIIVLPIRKYVAAPFIVNGASMHPTFETGQYLIVDQLSYRFENPQRGDVIIFKYPENPEKFFIKRIIGLPNETIDISGQKVTIINSANPDGMVLDQPFIELQKDSFVRTTLADDEYFVMGDNRGASLDSRSWGPLSKDMVIGQAFVRLFPINKVDYLPGDFNY